MTSNNDPIVHLAQHVTQTRFSDLPVDVCEAAKRSILDSVSVTIAGSSAPGIEQLRAQLLAWGGRPESRSALFGDVLTAHDAALLNITMAHALELDDAHYPAIVHPTAPTLWSGLATADALGGISGQDLITAVALGIDIMARLALAAPHTLDLGYHSELYASFAAAATVGKLRGLPHHQLVHAFGIAFPQSMASVQAGIDGALIKRMQLGLNAAVGMKAVMLAMSGVTGVTNILDGKYGLYRLFNHSSCNAEVILDNLGKRYLSAELSTKMYASSRCAHAAIEGTLALVARHGIKPDDVESITVEIQDGCFKREQRPYAPQPDSSQAAAQFSIDYNIAAAILWQDVFVDQTQERCTNDPRAIALARKVTILRNPEKGSGPYLPVRIVIRNRAKEAFEQVVRQLRGSSEAPLNWDEVVSERLEKCLPYSARPLSTATIEKLKAFIKDLEHQPDVTQLTSMLAGNQP